MFWYLLFIYILCNKDIVLIIIIYLFCMLLFIENVLLLRFKLWCSCINVMWGVGGRWGMWEDFGKDVRDLW